jgi:hypothetical protein
MELAHVVVSMVDGKPSKVQCKTCRGTHRYKTSGSSAPVKRSTAAPKTTIRASELWEQKMSKKHAEDVIPYQTTRLFAAGNVVKHPTFGLGIVEEVRPPTKVLVFFREGEKVLVHGLGQPKS